MAAEVPDQNTTVWFQNKFTRLAEANVNILTHALNYGSGVFEGIRGYYDEKQQELLLVRVMDHYERWKQNCGILRIAIPPSAEELSEITAELCRRNGFRSNVYVRPLAYKASARIGVHADDNDAYAIVVVPFGNYFGKQKGVKAGVVSWRRVEDNAIPGRAKICGAYVNSVLATDEAHRNGHDEAIFLNESGHVAEGATCNLFMLRRGKLVTPPPTDNILEGITRDSVIELARKELNLEVVERSIDRSELYVCDEIFFTGTAAEVAPIIAVDHRPVGTGEIGAVTQKIRSLYFDATRGRLPAYRNWLWPVYRPALEKTA
ncbi:MAG: branched-chain amino acid transaminase [Acidobacteriaceae bacterium]|nr:branched-chain amino acid transaminase [Acidobacteriaceae bacterium]MBV9498182.1 branched-chain amino acid transaminase [Acidobacteriaceae bacterium]